MSEYSAETVIKKLNVSRETLERLSAYEALIKKLEPRHQPGRKVDNLPGMATPLSRFRRNLSRNWAQARAMGGSRLWRWFSRCGNCHSCCRRGPRLDGDVH